MLKEEFDYGQKLVQEQQEAIKRDKEKFGDFGLLENRFGVIRVKDQTLTRYPRVFQEIMSHLLVTRCEMEFRHKGFTFEGFSEWFDEKEPQIIPLRYQVLVTEYDEPDDAGNHFSIEFIREDITRQLNRKQWIA